MKVILLEKEHIIYSQSRSGFFIIDGELSNEKALKNQLIDFSSGAPDVETIPYEDFQHCLNNAIQIHKETLL